MKSRAWKAGNTFLLLSILWPCLVTQTGIVSAHGPPESYKAQEPVVSGGHKHDHQHVHASGNSADASGADLSEESAEELERKWGFEVCTYLLEAFRHYLTELFFLYSNFNLEVNT
jgi:hypothetical protein